MKCRRVGKVLLLLATMVSLVWLVPTAAAYNSNARIVRLSYVDGDVQLDRREGQGFERAIMNMPITQGTRVWTRGSDALAEVEFEDGSALRLTPDTAVEFNELALRDSGEKVTSVDLQNGTAYFDVRKHMGDFRITFGGQQITVTQPASFRIFGDNGQFKLAVYKGDVDVRSGSNQVQVRKGETFSLDAADPNRYNLAKSIAEGSYDDWNQQRERYNESSATTYNGSNPYYNSFSPYYSYGLADLSYYGNYFFAPGWGWMWRPYYMSAGWDPFMDGAWAWYPQFGYMWVSSYPWGWMPYRYGAWNWVPGYGWCWIPGRTWNRWAPVTVVNRPPVGWHVPTPPAAPPAKGSPGILPVGRGWKTVYPPGTQPGRALLGNQPSGSKGWMAPATVSGAATTTTSTTTNATPAVTPPALTKPSKSAAPVVPKTGGPHTPSLPRSTGPKPATPAGPPSAPRSQAAPPSGAREGGWGGGQPSGMHEGVGHVSSGSWSGGHGGSHR
jgi:hypothetical protein